MLIIIQCTNFLYLLWYYFNLVRFFTCRFIWTAGKKTHVLKVTKFMNNLKNTELLTFLYMFRSFKLGFITVSTENYRGMAHIKICFSKYHVKTMKQTSRALWHQFCVYVSIIRRNFLFLSFIVLLPCTSGSFPHFFTSLLPSGLSRRPHVIEWLWFPYIYSRYLYMYLFGLTDKLPVKELR